MRANNVLTNNYVMETKPMIQMTRRSNKSFYTPEVVNTHTREVVITPDNSRVENLERQHVSIQNAVAEKDKQIHDLIHQIDTLRNTTVSNMESTTKYIHNVENSTNNKMNDIHSILSNILDNIKEKDNRLHDLATSIQYNKDSVSDIVAGINSVLAKKEEEIDNIKSFIHISNTHLDRKNEDVITSIQHANNSLADKQSQIDDLKNQLSNLSTSLSSIQNLRIGDQTHLPRQPDPVSVGGVWKTAPLSLAVNGGVVLHDIGYASSSKNTLPLVWDPTTSRLLINTGK